MVMELAHQSWRAMRRPACIYKHRGVISGAAEGRRRARQAAGILTSGAQRQPASVASRGNGQSKQALGIRAHSHRRTTHAGPPGRGCK